MVERKEEYIVDDQLDGSITIYQVKCMSLDYSIRDILSVLDPEYKGNKEEGGNEEVNWETVKENLKTIYDKSTTPAA